MGFWEAFLNWLRRYIYIYILYTYTLLGCSVPSRPAGLIRGALRGRGAGIIDG